MQSQDSTNTAVTGLIYLIVAVFCAALSAWSTFHGLAVMPLQIAGLIAAIIFLALFLCHYVVLRQRQNGATLLRAPFGLVGPLVLLLFVTALSASSSFAYFYNLVMRDSLAISRAQSAGEAFEANATIAENALRQVDRVAQLRDRIALLKTNLATEVLGANRNGFGDRAKQIVAEIEAVMREDVRRPIVVPTFPRVGSSEATDKAAYDLLTAAIDTNFNEWAADDKIQIGLAKLEEIRKGSAETVAEARSADADVSFQKRRDGIVDLAARTADIERTVNSALDAADLSPSPQPLTLAAPGEEGMGLTNIVEVYRAAFGEGRGPGVTAMSMFLAILLDLMPFAMAMVLFKPGLARSPRDSAFEDDGGRRARPSKGGDLNVRASKRWK